MKSRCNKPVIFTDIDTTIMQNFKNCAKNCIATSFKYGKPSSWMTESQFNKLREIQNKADVVAVTSRKMEMTLSIKTPKRLDAILCENGAIMLDREYRINAEWVHNSIKLMEKISNDIHEARKTMGIYGYTEKWGSQFVLDFISRDGYIFDDSEISNIKEKFSNNFVITAMSNNKVVLLTPNVMDKAKAIERYIDTNNIDPLNVIIAGDSEADFGMLSLPYQTIGPLGSNAKYKFNRDIQDKSARYDFSDFVLDSMLKLT